MTISEPVRSVDTHELVPGDIYPHPVVGETYSLSHREVCSLFSDHIMYFCSALVILVLVFIAGVFFRKLMTSSAGRKRGTVSVIPDAKPEAQSKPEYFHLSICVEGPASTDDSVLSSLASRVVREAEDLYIPASIAATALTTCLPGPCRLSFLLTGSSSRGYSRRPAGLNVRI